VIRAAEYKELPPTKLHLSAQLSQAKCYFMARNPLAIKFEIGTKFALLSDSNSASDNYVMRRIALSSITLAVQFCLSDRVNAH